jgi:hypothetical protein
VYIAHINNLPAIIVFPHLLFFAVTSETMARDFTVYDGIDFEQAVQGKICQNLLL